MGDCLASIPMAALGAVMIMVSITAFSWQFIRNLKQYNFWDITTVAALDKVVLKLRRNAIEVDVIGTNRAITTLIVRGP